MAVSFLRRRPGESAVGSPLWWLETLEAALNKRRPHMELMDRYYRGDHPLPFLTRTHESKMRTEFATLLADSRSNFMRLVVDAVEERLAVEGFRLSAEDDPISDKESWAIWQANQMDSESQTALLESLVKGASYISVWPGAGEHPEMAVEDPLQTIVAYEAGSNYRRRSAAAKIWRDEWTGELRANVYLPDGIYKYAGTAEPTAQVGTEQARRVVGEAHSAWRPLPSDAFVQNPLGVVPIVPLRNRPRLLVEGESEIEDVYRIQNQINAFLFLLALAGYFGAHRQRWVVGLAIMEDERGNAKEPFNVAIDRLWQTENPDVKFGEFSQTSLDGYISAIEQKVLHIAVTTRTPRHYLEQAGQSPSGDAIEGAEAGLVKKTERKQGPFGEGLEEALRLARAFAGSPAAPPDSEIVWRDPRTRSEASVSDAVIKQYQARIIPRSTALEKLGYSQTQVRQILSSPEEEFAPEPAPPAPPGPAAEEEIPA